MIGKTTPPLWALAGPLLVTACGDADVEFEQPQIVPQSNVLCLSYDEVPAQAQSTHFVQLTNLGRDPLEITGVSVDDDGRGAFAIDQMRNEDLEDCPFPCRVRTDQDVFLRFFYTPPSPGWDHATLRVESNAQNYPSLRLFVLGKARPSDLPAAQPYDAGPKPDAARADDGTEACPDPT